MCFILLSQMKSGFIYIIYIFHLPLISTTHQSCLQTLLTPCRQHECLPIWTSTIIVQGLSDYPVVFIILTFFSRFQPCWSYLFSKCTHHVSSTTLPSALHMHHPSKLMTSLKGLLQYKVCILSNILSAFVLPALPPSIVLPKSLKPHL